MIDVTQRTLFRGSSRSAALLPVAFHFNPRANGTMVLSAMMHEIEGADPIQVPKQAFGVYFLLCNSCFVGWNAEPVQFNRMVLVVAALRWCNFLVLTFLLG